MGKLLFMGADAQTFAPDAPARAVIHPESQRKVVDDLVVRFGYRQQIAAAAFGKQGRDRRGHPIETQAYSTGKQSGHVSGCQREPPNPDREQSNASSDFGMDVADQLRRNLFGREIHLGTPTATPI